VAITMIVHPSVVRLYDAGACGSQVWLSLEMVEGETLAQKLRAGRPPLADILHWIQQACDGLAEAHRVGVVHRSLTPDNILVMPGGAVKVIDFGMAKLRSWGVATTRDLQVGAALYAPPEQTRGADAHASMDVYALGHVLYEAIAGEHAIGVRACTPIVAVAWHINERPRPLHERAPEVPPDIEQLVHEAIDKDPEKRPTMQAFHRRLRDAQAHLRVPQRRAARNAPPVERGEGLAPTIPMAAVTAPVESAPTASLVAPRRAPVAAIALGTLMLAAVGWMAIAPAGAGSRLSARGHRLGVLEAGTGEGAVPDLARAPRKGEQPCLGSMKVESRLE
jgi:serine/threonine-protein kinase